MLLFTQKWGGGVSSTFIDDLFSFHKSFVKPGRIVPATTWKALAELKLAAHEMCPFFVYAVLKTQARCADSQCDGKVCKYISVTEINSLASTRKSEMIAAERVLSECRTLARTSGASDEARTKAFARLDVVVVKLTLGKKDLKDATSMEDVARQFAEEIGMLTKSEAKPSSTTDDTMQPNVVAYDNDGNVIAATVLSLRADGFKPGVTVKYTADDLPKGSYGLYKIESIDDDVVNLKDMQSGTMSKVSVDNFYSKYKKTTDRYEEFQEWQEHVPGKQASYKDAVARAHVTVALSKLASDTTLPNVKVIRAPERSVFADSPFNVGKLQLVPETSKIGFESKPGWLQGAVDGRAFYLMPSQCSNEFAVPAWVIKGTSNIDAVNVHATTKKVTITVGGNSTIVVQVPVITNSRKLKVGDELLIAKAENVQKASGKRCLHLEPATKAKCARS